MTLNPLKGVYTPEQFSLYVASVVDGNMMAWRPRGFVLHNTFDPTLKQSLWDGTHNRAITMPERVENTWERYRQLGWYGGPHLFVWPGKIVTGNPLWARGTHSPSWNTTFWALELVGNFDIEEFPEASRTAAVSAMADLYAMLGHEPDDATFHFHGEDPNTSHKHCPGKNVGPKTQWVTDIRKAMVRLDEGDHTPST